MVFLIFVFLFTAFTSPLLAQVNINGDLTTYQRIRLEQEGKWSWNEQRLGLEFRGSPSNKIHYYSRMRFRAFGFPDVTNTHDLRRREKDKVAPWGMEFREAYIDLYGFIDDNLDVRIGRQRIAWGKADKINPTDNLNPDDLEDIFNFGCHLGSNAIRATYYLGDYTFSGVFIPVFTPATLPYGEWSEAFASSIEMPSGFQMASFRDHVRLPEDKLSETSSFGVRVSTLLWRYDISLSYYYGRDDIPLVSQMSLSNTDARGFYDVQVELTYPKMQVIGMNIAGSIGSVGVWAEGGIFFPEKVHYFYFMDFPHPDFGRITKRKIALHDDPYFKYIVGGDYTFENGWYVNAQFLHGFLHERGSENLNNYILMRFEKTYRHGTIKVIPIGVALAIPDWENVSNNYGIAGGPEIAYYPIDALEISMGAYIIEGKGNNIFSRVEGLDELFLKIKYYF